MKAVSSCRHIIVGKHFDKQKNKTIRVYNGKGCIGCDVQSIFIRYKDGIRYIKEFSPEAERNVMKAKMKTPRAKELYKLRSRTVEPPFGDIKENKGMRSFLTRSPEMVRTEFNLICATGNLRKIMRFLKEKNKNISPFKPR